MTDLTFFLKDRRDVLGIRHPVMAVSAALLRHGRLILNDQQCREYQGTDANAASNPMCDWGSLHGVVLSFHWITVTLTKPLVQQHCACPAPETPDASLARTRSM